MTFKQGNKLYLQRKQNGMQGKEPWNKGKSMEAYPHAGFQKGHQVFAGSEKTQFQKGQSSWNSGLILTNEQKKNLYRFPKGNLPFNKGKEHLPADLNGRWRGDFASYKTKHAWRSRNLVKPLNCEACGLEKKLDWANVSGKYYREETDWMPLCRSCHIHFDRNRCSF